MRRLTAFMLLLFLPCFCYAAQEVYSAASVYSPVLTMHDGARPAALGGAYSAIAEGANAVVWNAAALGFSADNQLGFTGRSWIAGSYLSTFTFSGKTGSGGAGMALRTATMGEHQARDEYGNDEGYSIGVTDVGLRASCGIRFGEAYAFGISVDGSDLIIDGGHNLSLGLDLSFLYRWPDASVAACLFGYAGTGNNLGMKLGGAAKMFGSGSHRLLLTGEVKAVFSGNADYGAGFEYSFSDIMWLRIGYSGESAGPASGAAAGLSAGAGIRTGMLKTDYAAQWLGDLGLSHTVTVALCYDTPPNSTGRVDETGYVNSDGARIDAIRLRIEAGENKAELWREMGVLYIKEGSRERGMECLKKALELKPDDEALREWIEKAEKEKE